MKQRRRLIGLVLSLAFLVAACGQEDSAFVEDFIKSWLLAHPIEVIAAKTPFGSGDPMIDAAVEGQEVISAQDDADKEFQKAYVNGDTQTMDDLIAKHPNDWGYKVDRASVALEQGEPMGLYVAPEYAYILEEGLQARP